MRSGIIGDSARNEDRTMEEPNRQIIVQDGRHTNASTQPRLSNLDNSEPEVVSDSDEDEEIFFKPNPPLPSSNVIKRTLRELRDLMNTPYLNLDSTEHRPRLYDENHALTGIIDSLSQNYDFPPIFFNQKQVRGPDGSIQYNRICIDGLKRLSSIKAFMDGEIPCHDYRRRKWYYCPNAKKGSEEQPAGEKRYLPDDFKEDFMNKHFVCHEFEDLTKLEEIELRARVHLGSTLAPGEKLRAIMVFSGDLMINFAKILQNDFQQIAELADTRKSKGFQNLMKCSSQILEVQKAAAEKRQPVLRISDTALNSFIKHADASLLTEIEKALGVFSILVTRYPQEFHSMPGTSFSSMEVITIAVLTFKYFTIKIKPWLFIRLIGSLRQSLHNFSHHQGVLQTRQTWQHAWNCIQGFDEFVVEGEASDLNSAMQQGMQNNALKSEEQGSYPIQSKSVAKEIEQPGGSQASATFSFSLQNPTIKRKGSPHPLDPAKKRVHLPTPVSPANLQSSDVSLRATSPDSVLGSDGSEDEQMAEGSETVVQSAATAAQEPDKNASSEPAPRQLVRSSFKKISKFVPCRSESPKSNSTPNIMKPNNSTLSTLNASVPVLPNPPNAISSSPTGSNIQFETSRRPAIKPSLLYSHESKKRAPYQPSAMLAAAESPIAQESDNADSAADVERRHKSRSPGGKRLASQSGSRHVTPVHQSSNSRRPESPTVPPYSGRGRPRKYPPKSVTPEGLTPKGRGRPRKNSNAPIPEPMKEQAYGIRGRPRKNIPGGFSTRATSISTSQLAPEPNILSPPNAEQSKPPKPVDQLREPVTSKTLERIEGADRDKPSQLQPSEVQKASPAPVVPSQKTTLALPPITKNSAPTTQNSKEAAPDTPDREPPVPATTQSRAVSISSSREPSVSHMSTVGSLTNATPRTTPDPSLIDAKPFIAPFKVGSANAIRERRRQQQVELEERRKRLEAGKIASSTAESSKSNA